MFYFLLTEVLAFIELKFQRRRKKGFAQLSGFQLMTSYLGLSLENDNGEETTSDKQNVQPITESFKGQTASDLLLYVNFTMTKEQMF